VRANLSAHAGAVAPIRLVRALFRGDRCAFETSLS